jgi:hypothetical protein
MLDLRLVGGRPSVTRKIGNAARLQASGFVFRDREIGSAMARILNSKI